MYVIPFSVLRHYLGEATLSPEEEGPPVTISAGLFRRLLQDALLTHPFDESAYLAANPDVASSVRRGEFGSGRAHFIERGYFEGRGSYQDEFDESWYVKANSDVARSIRAGTYPSGKAHFLSAGAAEFRAPSGACEADMNLWRASLRPDLETSGAMAE